MEERRIIYLPTSEIHPAPWNPPIRTESRNLQSLIKSMRANGFFWYVPLIVGRGDILADGHRRYAAAVTLGIPQVPVLRIDKAADLLWAELNGMRRPVSSAESLEGYLLGLEHVPEQHAGDVAEYMGVMGEEAARLDFMRGVSPRVLDIGRRILRYLGKTGDKDLLRMAVLWLRKHRMSRSVRWITEVEDDESDPNLLLGYILADKPLPKLSAILPEAQA